MPDPVLPPTPPGQTNPRTAGVDTSEHGFAKFAQIVSTVVVAGGLILSSLGALFTQLHGVFPTVGWIAAAATTIGGIAGLVVNAKAWISGRSDVKVAIENTTAAQALAVSNVDAPTLANLQRPVSPATGARPYAGP